jgi:hypothetical protein
VQEGEVQGDPKPSITAGRIVHEHTTPEKKKKKLKNQGKDWVFSGFWGNLGLGFGPDFGGFGPESKVILGMEV